MICEFLTINGEVILFDGEPLEFCYPNETRQTGGRVRNKFRTKIGDRMLSFDTYDDAMQAIDDYEKSQIVRFKPRKPVYY